MRMTTESTAKLKHTRLFLQIVLAKFELAFLFLENRLLILRTNFCSQGEFEIWW